MVMTPESIATCIYHEHAMYRSSCISAGRSKNDKVLCFMLVVASIDPVATTLLFRRTSSSCLLFLRIFFSMMTSKALQDIGLRNFLTALRHIHIARWKLYWIMPVATRGRHTMLQMVDMYMFGRTLGSFVLPWIIDALFTIRHGAQ